MIELDVKADGIANLQRLMLVESAETRKALVAAIRGEAFSLRQSMRQNILMGAPAPGQPFRPLSMIARSIKRRKGFGLRAPFPLRRLAAAVTYDVSDAGLTVRVGFTARSAAWARRAAERQQTGFTRPISERTRRYLASQAERRRASRSHRAQRTGNPMLLRKSTTVFRVPARPIVDPFWRHARGQVVAAIRKNFREKLAGRSFAAGVMDRYRVATTTDFWEQ